MTSVAELLRRAIGSGYRPARPAGRSDVYSGDGVEECQNCGAMLSDHEGAFDSCPLSADGQTYLVSGDPVPDADQPCHADVLLELLA